MAGQEGVSVGQEDQAVLVDAGEEFHVPPSIPWTIADDVEFVSLPFVVVKSADGFTYRPAIRNVLSSSLEELLFQS